MVIKTDYCSFDNSALCLPLAEHMLPHTERPSYNQWAQQVSVTCERGRAQTLKFL